MINLYLSRLIFNLNDAEAAATCNDVYALHRISRQAFLGRRVDRCRVLWRLDDGHVMLIQSEQMPTSWDGVLREGFLLEPPETKAVRIALREQQLFRFRMQVNPAQRPRAPKGTPSIPIRAIKSPTEREQWLRSKFENNGLQIQSMTEQGLWVKKFRKADQKHQVVLVTALYEGYVGIINPEMAETCLASGVGRGKAFGHGMLSLAAPA